VPKYHKLHRGICLALFTLAGTYSLINPHVFKTAALALIGVICYDVVCLLRQKSEVKDYGSEVKELSDKVAETAQHIKEMKDDVSIGKIANTFRRDR